MMQKEMTPAKLSKAVLAAFLWMGISPGYSLQFPSLENLKAEYPGKSYKEGDITHFTRESSKNKEQLEVQLKNNKPYFHKYIQAKSFTDHEISQLAKKYGQGGTWHEMSLNYEDKKKYASLHPGIEQHWQLQGFNNETGWMASGLQNDKFWICFMEKSPVKEKEPEGPFSLNSDIYGKLKKSGTWLEIDCGDGKESRCFKSILSSQIELKLHSNEIPIYAKLVENNSIQEIEATLKSLTKGEYREYSRDLEGLSESEGQTAIFKFAEAIPELFNWNGPQIQKAKVGIIKAEEYLKKFKQQGTQWESIPIFKKELKNSTVTIELDYNGNYHLRIQ